MDSRLKHSPADRAEIRKLLKAGTKQKIIAQMFCLSRSVNFAHRAPGQRARRNRHMERSAGFILRGAKHAR
jgi:hypothetical protein